MYGKRPSATVNTSKIGDIKILVAPALSSPVRYLEKCISIQKLEAHEIFFALIMVFKDLRVRKKSTYPSSTSSSSNSEQIRGINE